MTRLKGRKRTMSLVTPSQNSPIKLRLGRDLVRALKRGHPWVFADALRQRPPAPPGSPAVLLDNKRGREFAWGFYDAHSPLAFRVCTVELGERLDDAWAEKRMSKALSLRRLLFDEQTTGFRLFNGEGDGLPGLICDLYGDTAVLQLDGAGPSGFWDVRGIAQWLAAELSLKSVYHGSRTREDIQSRVLVGSLPAEPLLFLENGVRFSVDIIRGQKTGFFLDQRENRQRIKRIAANRRVLNLFGYTGGFSVYAGLGGANQVTTVDVAAPALQTAQRNWQLNGLAEAAHTIVRADAFEFLEQAVHQKHFWELVIVDPPSFASSKEAVNKAILAYQKLIAAAAAVTTPAGFLAAASCSSHVDLAMFLDACETGVAQARRRATVLSITGQPADHPTPLPFSEFRYLKFVLLWLE
jgi:23S rRNA (cytosine1962-C5)-methyltransferase